MAQKPSAGQRLLNRQNKGCTGIALSGWLWYNGNAFPVSSTGEIRCRKNILTITLGGALCLNQEVIIVLINEVCKLTGLTKKAVEYYEKQGLLIPEIMENGYRKYRNKEISVLKEISLLRKMGIGIADIKIILVSDDKLASLAVCKSKMTRQINMLNIQHECISHLLNSGYNIDSSFQYTTHHFDENRVIKERLAEAFPGNYGLFLSFHFGRFLNEKIDSPEKEAAYGKILEFLDDLADISLPMEIEDYMMEVTGLWNEDVMQALDDSTKAAIDDYDSFMETKRDIVKMYLEYRKSDAYKYSPAYKMQNLMLDFQKASGYVDVFIENMKILSHEYSEYHKKLHELNDIFLRDYPDAADILGYY